eukprot:s1353_g5.t1
MIQDRGIRAEIQTVQHDLRAHREAQKNMFVKVFQPPDRAYDSGRRVKKSLESQSSVELGLDDFESQVLRSNEVWFVQAYDPNDGSCKSFATGWEDVAHTYGEHAHFGRLDVSKAELKAALLSLGFPALKEVRKHKVSFHATYFLNFESGEGVVLQLLGSELGDKAPKA